MSSFKAFDKRNKTLLVEYKNQFKANKFTDKRIGENDQTLTLEDKMFKRFVAQRQKPREKKSKKFNLNDDEDAFGLGDNDDGVHELTHMGQSIAQMENFEKVQLSDDDDEDYDDPNDKDKGRISAKIVSENFFGGFTKNNKAKRKEGEEGEGEEDDESRDKKNKKQWIDELILKSKQLKYERQKERDKTLDLTEQLDKEWRNIIPLIGSMVNKNKQKEAEEEEKQRKENELENLTKVKTTTTKKTEDYDYLVRSLQFESEKAQPTNKLKTVAELEKERLEQIKKSQKELLERMNNEVNGDNEEETTKDKSKNKSTNLKKIPLNHYSVDDMEFDEPEYLQAMNKSDIKQMRLEEARQEQEEEKNGVKQLDDDEEDENEEDYEDLSESNTDTQSLADSSSSLHVKSSKFSEFTNDKWIIQFKNICAKLNKQSIDAKQFEQLLGSIIQRLDPSRDEKNKLRICLLVEHIIDYYQSIFKTSCTLAKSLNKNVTNDSASVAQKNKIDFGLIEILKKIIYEMTLKYGNKSTKKEPSIYVELFKKILTDISNDYVGLKISEKKFPDLCILFTFKLISGVFPTSDFRHQISTPCLLIMTRYLTECATQTIGDCFRGLFLCNLCLEFVSLSKRFIPECIQYLNGILYLAIDWKNSATNLTQYERSTIYESFKKTQLNFLVKKKLSTLEELSLLKTSVNETQQITDTQSASMIAYSLDIMISFAKIYEDCISYREIFHLSIILLKLLPSENYPPELKSRIQKLKEILETSSQKPREYLKCLNKKPLATKLFEPRVQTKSKFDPRHHNSVISEKQLNARKYKKELKSAIKEIRQDNQYLARVQLSEQLEKDAKRSQKVKEIMGSLATQEGEYQKAKRQKN